MAGWNRGQTSTPENSKGSPLMTWIRDHLDYRGEGCLSWPFARSRDGYASIQRDGKNVKVHRFICQRIHGDPPTPEHHAAHSCGNGAGGCVHPGHLSWKTASENSQESARHPRRKLTPAQVEEIRGLKDQEIPRVLAERFGVTEGTIRKIFTGLNWNRKSNRVERYFTADELNTIKELRGRKPGTEIAKEYGVRPDTIYRIWVGKTHVNAG